MNCPVCQTVNPEDAKFCMNCGSKLALVCENCGTELPADAKFCFNCGHKVASTTSAAPAELAKPAEPEASSLERFVPKQLLAKLESARSSRAMEGERRIVTMLFCDVQGSTASAGQLDPEDWAEIMNGAFEFMIAPVYHYEGTVARLMGDAILAFFGAPIAHEDDPRRAILAGLEIVNSIQDYRAEVKRKWGVDFNVRVGINTGLVVVGAVGSDLRLEYTAMGDAINLASRMEQTASPGTVQIAEDTRRLIAPLFEFEDLGRIEVKGKDEPVPAYRVLRAKADPGRLRGIEGLESPLVGRDAEMHTLRGAVIELRQGKGQIISVMAEAGLGKSRLIAELRHSPTPVAGKKLDLVWLEGRSLSYETSTPYAPFIELFGGYFDLLGEESDEARYARLKRQTAAVAPDRAEDIVPFIASMLGIAPAGIDSERVKYLEPPQLRSRVFQAVADLIECLATEKPVVLVLDDIHWIDSTSLDLLEQLMLLTDRAVLMIIALFRPRRHEPSWHFHELAEREYGHRYVSLALRRLDSSYSRELIGNLLEVEDLPETVRQLILDKAEGNPFFMEEVIRSLLDAGLIVRQNSHWRATQAIEHTTVPDTLAAVITTRVDQLADESKQLLQTASVIGREFPFDTLIQTHETQANVDDSLTDLQRRELISEKSRLPVRQYLFKHALTQETVYGSLLLRKRRELHLRVAECLERIQPERAGEIARHFSEAREAVRCLPYLIKAGDQAAHAYSTPEAIAYYERALETLETVANPELARRAYEGLGGALTFANDLPRAVETYQEMLQLAEAKGDIPMQVSALNKLSYLTAMRMGQFQEAEGYLLEADQRARENEDKVGLSEMSIIRCMMCTAVADFDGVVHYMDEAVSLGRGLGVKEQMVQGMTHIASSKIYMLQFDEAWQIAQEGLQLAQEIGDREHETEILTATVPLYHLRNGDIAAARSAAETGIEVASRIGSVNSALFAYRNLGAIAHAQGDYERAIDYYRRYQQFATQGGAIWSQADALCVLGTVYLDINPDFLDKVKELHGEAKEYMSYPGGTMLGGSAWTELGRCALIVGMEEAAAEYFQLGLDNPTITQNLDRPRLLLGQASVALARHDLAQAEEFAGQAQAIVDEHKMKNLSPQVAFFWAQLAQGQADFQSALSHIEQAEAEAGEMGLRPLVWRASAGAARLLTQMGRPAEAEAKNEIALAAVDEMASLFADEELRQAFLAHVAPATSLAS